MIQLTAHDGGGTAFKPVLDCIARCGIQPVCVVYLADVRGSAFGPPPDYPVVWISTELNQTPFAEVIMHWWDGWPSRSMYARKTALGLIKHK
jgi:hypothetical protein